ncbi:MAG TPA: methylmalonyl Co-A mutase-associated GTPase MeaB, partial [Chryseosolibacter sp.]|nr:methylmalonyl Co-A mutase-associated GTPase MeaB [Chryseosolibacter sp.]
AGDELQGIKKGIMEMADCVVITKADGDNVANATRAQAEYHHALHLSSHASRDWRPKVLTCSAITGAGIESVWQTISHWVERAKRSGAFDKNRSEQNIAWFEESFDHLLRLDIQRHSMLRAQKDHLLAMIGSQAISPQSAAQKLLEHYHQAIRQL